jgi:predicted kinase
MTHREGTYIVNLIPFTSRLPCSPSQHFQEFEIISEQRTLKMTKKPPTIPSTLSPLLRRDAPDPRPVVLATCGIAGAGKSTLAKLVAITHLSFTRVSIDAIVAEKHGLWGNDYAPDRYESYLDEAEEESIRRLRKLLSEKRDVVLDRSFWRKADRESVRKIVEDGGGRWVLVYLKAERDVLWRRIQKRQEGGRDADSAYWITEKVLDGYVKGFEAPDGEGELVVEVK